MGGCRSAPRKPLSLLFCPNRLNNSHPLIFQMFKRQLLCRFYVPFLNRPGNFLMLYTQTVLDSHPLSNILHDICRSAREDYSQEPASVFWYQQLHGLPHGNSHPPQPSLPVAFRRTGLENLSRLLQLPDIRICHISTGLLSSRQPPSDPDLQNVIPRSFSVMWQPTNHVSGSSQPALQFSLRTLASQDRSSAHSFSRRGNLS